MCREHFKFVEQLVRTSHSHCTMVVMSSFLVILVLSAMVVETSTAQLTNIVGSTSVSVNPTDATCGRTSADTYCRVDTSPDVGCVIHTCRTACEARVRGPTYTNLLSDVSGFNYDGTVTSTTKDFGDGNITVAVFNKATRMAFLRGSVNMTTLNDDFTLTFRIRPADNDGER